MPAGEQNQTFTRRRMLIGAVALGGVAAVGGAGYALAPDRVKVRLGLGPDPFIPDAPEGEVTLETVFSKARNRDVDLFTAVPDGFGDGAGLPVVVVLHGGSATASEFRDFGFGRFLTQAVLDGAEPFVLAGADGGLLGWEPNPADASDDPQAMLADEMPRWLAERGYDAERRALWGWSMGGYGSLRMAEVYPEWARAVAAFSPAIGVGDSVFDDAGQLDGQSLAIWCGTDDMFYSAITQFVDGLSTEPEIVSYTEGEAHTRTFWNDQTLDAFDFLSGHLAT